METSTKINLANVAKNLELPTDKVSSAVQLLEAGNTIPFITRYRKDETGGLGERQLRDIRQEVARQTALAERKAVVLKAIENHGKLTDELRQQIENTDQARQVEDLYHPFKPRKTSLAETARQQGLEPLARDILEGHQPDIDLASRATDFVRVDKGLTSVDDVITGVKHILAERFTEHLQLRAQLRSSFWQTGKIKTVLIATAEERNEAKSAATPVTPATAQPAATEPAATEPAATQPAATQPAATEPAATQPAATQPAATQPAATEPAATQPAATQPAATEPAATQPAATQPAASDPESVSSDAPNDSVEHVAAKQPSTSGEETASPDAADSTPVAESPPTPELASTAQAPPSAAVSPVDAAKETLPATEASATATETVTETAVATMPADTETARPKKKRKKKKKKKKSRPDPFAEFANYEESLQKIPPHRTLAINRGERAGKLKVRITSEPKQLNELARSSLIKEGHPFAEFLATVSDDAMSRLILPSIEREIRRDLTERSETHAVSVFARNLRHLFLQPPVRGYRIMGIDPGYRSGCKVAVIDETGQPLGHGVFSIVGNEERIQNNKKRLVDLINQHQPQLIAIGNGSGCRAVEQFVSDVISGELANRSIQYSIVNQAGTSAYSTSELGQFELPSHDPVIRSAISIARPLQDPLSELVKVNPANVGVGLYQHDIKAKHLSDSLESVVESCVNFVGVNANTASPSLLKYISGLGQTTARKLVDHRNENGPFPDRQKLREVSGFGDVTFVQSAGFLRIDNRGNPLDQTSIHPEDYELANKILTKLGCTIEDLIPPPKPLRFAHAKTDKQPTAPATSTAEVKLAAAAESSAQEPAQPTAEAAPTEIAGPTEPTKSPSPETIEQETQASTAVSTDIETATDSAGEVTPPKPDAAGKAAAVSEPALEPAPQTESTTPTKAAAVLPPETVKPAMSPAEAAEKRKRRRDLVQNIKSLNATELAKELGVGELKLRDMLRALRNPAQDPRDDLPAPVFRKGILKFDDLKQGMQLRGQIVNVVDFGVFLNIGIGESCLVHISRLANRYVRDPHWYYSVGDVLNVWVQEIDSEKRRVTLTAIRPDSAKRERRKPRSEQGSGIGRSSRRDGGGGQGRGAAAGKGKKRHAPARGKPHHKRPRKPKPVKPITDDMVEGKEPMRSFSDLLQFHKRKTDDDPKDKS